jgi:NTP pyrophosphatase (non-canonical NTP hydrolase)
MNKLIFIQITDWQRETFPASTALSSAKHLKKEVEELILAIEKGDKENIEEELADCFFMLFSIADREGLDYNQLTYQVQLKLMVNKSRVWNKPDADGCVHHSK